MVDLTLPSIYDWSGMQSEISRSKRPALLKPGSKASGLLVAAITKTGIFLYQLPRSVSHKI
jgi:hypothetical protein